jgi:hypothetical protein
MDNEISQARSKALAEVDRLATRVRLALAGGCLIEVAMLTGLLLLMDFHNRTHWILLIGFVGTYSIVAMVILALFYHVSRIGERILRGVDLALDR